MRRQRQPDGPVHKKSLGHYALDPQAIVPYPPADITFERIGDLVTYELTALLGAAKADNTR